MMRGVCIAVLGALAPGLAWGGDLLPNDHGRTIGMATSLPGGSNIITGVLEHDTDVDVFSFPFNPWMTYTIAVDTGTVWDVRVDIIPPAGPPAAGTTNSVWSETAAFTNLYHEGAQSRWYIRVSGLFQFTTGAYHLAVWAHPGQDSEGGEGDGFPDAWELHHFGDLDTADPDLHNGIFRTGRAPGDPLSMNSIQATQTGDVLGWSVAAYGTYDLYTSTNLLEESGWQYLATHVAGAEGATLHLTNSPSTGPRRFYHIRFRDE